MKGIAGIMVCLFANAALAQDLNFQDYKKFLLQGAQKGSQHKLAISTTCKNGSGETFRIGEKGYDTCMNEAKAPKHDTSKTEAPSAKDDVTTNAEIK